MITPVAWAVHCAIYPAFAVYVLLVTESMDGFDGFLADTTDYWERHRAGVDQLACSRA